MSNWEQRFKDYINEHRVEEVFDGSGEKFDFRGPFGMANKGNSKVYLVNYEDEAGAEQETRVEFFETNDPNIYEAAFRSTEPKGDASPYEERTRSGKAIQLLNTVVDIIKDFSDRNPQLEALVYQAEQKRLNIYAPMFKFIENRGEILPGWESGTHFNLSPTRKIHYIKEPGKDLSQIDPQTLL